MSITKQTYRSLGKVGWILPVIPRNKTILAKEISEKIGGILNTQSVAQLISQRLLYKYVVIEGYTNDHQAKYRRIR